MTFIEGEEIEDDPCTTVRRKNNKGYNAHLAGTVSDERRRIGHEHEREGGNGIEQALSGISCRGDNVARGDNRHWTFVCTQNPIGAVSRWDVVRQIVMEDCRKEKKKKLSQSLGGQCGR